MRCRRRDCPAAGVVVLLAAAPGALAAFRDFASAYPSLFEPEALRSLWAPRVYPPSVAVASLRASRFELCEEEGRLHSIEVGLARVVPGLARAAGDNASADFVLVPHCLGNRHSHAVQACLKQGRFKADRERSRLCDAFARKSLEPYFRAWVGELRRAGARALVVLTFATARVFSEPFLRVPHVISYMGPTDWMQVTARASASGSRSRPRFGCPGGRSSVDDGRQSFFYPRRWRDDVTVHAPSPFMFSSDWQPAAGRDLLFVFAGANVSCLRAALLAQWGKSSLPDVVVSDTGARGDLALHVRGAGDAEYSALLRRARFCLVVDGHVPWSYRFLDALHHGCVPCVVSESWHPPLHRLLGWTSADFPAVFVHPSRITDLHDILAAHEAPEWRRKQSLTLPLAALLDARTDTFHEATLAELALVAKARRHGAAS